MGDILWLASYPKSGNTWLRILLTNYLGDSPLPADINALGGDPICSSRDLFDQAAGVRSASLPATVVERLRPEVYRLAARAGAQTMRIKAHDSFRLTDTGEPIFPADVSWGVVYLVRDPRDVAVSYAHHAGIPPERSVRRINDPAAGLARKHPALQLPQRVGSWSGHVRSWVDQLDIPVLVVRYEDLLSQTVEVFAQVLRFAGHDPDDFRVRRAVDHSSLVRLQEQEAISPFRERPMRSTDRFFRRGVAGGWREELDPGLARLVEREHRVTMSRFGYLETA
ncbi:MAG: sulfotransferase [Marmoricola sp.]|nr:sulfotransferase [Marmoricola sp.]